MKTVNKFLAAVGALIVIVGYLYLSSPGKLVVLDSGDVDGPTNQARQILQGQRFWENQLFEVNRELDDMLAWPQELAEFDREMERQSVEYKRDAELEWERFYRENPELRPTAAERKAQALRDRADELMDLADDIELAQQDRELEEWRIQYVEELRRIRQLVESRL